MKEATLVTDLSSHVTVLRAEVAEISNDINKLLWLSKKYGNIFRKSITFLEDLRDEKSAQIRSIEDNLAQIHHTLHSASRLTKRLKHASTVSYPASPPTVTPSMSTSPVYFKSPGNNSTIMTNSTILSYSPQAHTGHFGSPIRGTPQTISSSSLPLYSPILAHRSP
ncbi:hypothetical protein RCL1_005457 [Eukaryota sp. TZLM3-RCL]